MACHLPVFYDSLIRTHAPEETGDMQPVTVLPVLGVSYFTCLSVLPVLGARYFVSLSVLPVLGVWCIICLLVLPVLAVRYLFVCLFFRNLMCGISFVSVSFGLLYMCLCVVYKILVCKFFCLCVYVCLYVCLCVATTQPLDFPCLRCSRVFRRRQDLTRQARFCVHLQHCQSPPGTCYHLWMGITVYYLL